MRKYLTILFSPLIFFGICACSACASGKTKPVFIDGEKTTIEGVVKFVGNEPMSKLVIETENAQVIIPKKTPESAKGIIGKKVKAEGIIKTIPVESSDHKYKFFQYRMDEPVFK